VAQPTLEAEIISCPKRTYADLAGHFRSGLPFFIGRIGGSDWDFAAYYSARYGRGPCPSIDADPQLRYLVNTVKRFNGYYDLDENPENIRAFCNVLIDCYADCDAVTIGGACLQSMVGWIREGEPGFYPESWDESAALMNSCVSRAYSYGYIEGVMGFVAESFRALEGKKVLVCSPFTESIARQFERRERLFGHLVPDVLPAGFEYPNFELLTLTTPVTYAGIREFPHRNWFETTIGLCSQIGANDFDIALLGCGSYALPLGSYVKKLGKGAIYIGGVLQLLFGIRGRRFESNPWYERLFTNDWIRPVESLPSRVTVSPEHPLDGFGAYW
jgi:hypothetical protein